MQISLFMSLLEPKSIMCLLDFKMPKGRKITDDRVRKTMGSYQIAEEKGEQSGCYSSPQWGELISILMKM